MSRQCFNLSWRLLVFLLATLFIAGPTSAQTCNSAIIQSTPDSRFQNHSNGTVTDLQTGLMWKQCSQGLSGIDCASGTVITTTGDMALQQGESLNNGGGFAGYLDWRLPNRKELESLVEDACYSPAINVTLFPNTPDSFYWSSSPAGGGFVWGVVFEQGLTYYSYYNVNLPVRLVRSLQ